MTRRRLATTGTRGNLVRLFEETRAGVKRYIVQWGPARQQTSFAGTREGKAEAEAFFKAYAHESATNQPAAAPLTVAQLWAAYREAEFPTIRPNTRRLYTEAWRHFENFIHPETIAQQITVPQIAAFRTALEGAGLATATVHRTITACRVVYAWGERLEVIEKNRWHLYRFKVAKEKRTAPRAEFRQDEFLALWRSFDPSRPGQWRPFVLTGLLGIYGNRQTELLAGLRWPNISETTIRIDGRYVKTGETIELPILPLAAELLRIAREWAATDGYTGPQVLYPGSLVASGATNASKTPYYTIQSYTAALDAAHARAGVEKIRFRAGHGFRRGLVGDLADLTGDVHAALQAIGDKDIRMAQHYRVRRGDKTKELLERRIETLGEIPKEVRSSREPATKMQPKPQNETADVETSAAKER